MHDLLNSIKVFDIVCLELVYIITVSEAVFCGKPASCKQLNNFYHDLRKDDFVLFHHSSYVACKMNLLPLGVFNLE